MASLLIPMPVSTTLKRILMESSLRFSTVAERTISPFSVNLTALPSKLFKICVKRVRSPISIEFIWVSIDKWICTPFISALGANKSIEFSSTSSNEKSAASRVTLPASILLISRISLMICSKDRDED